MPRRKSIGCVATKMRSPIPGAIIARPEPPTEPRATRSHPHRHERGSGLHELQSRWTKIVEGAATSARISRPARKPASKQHHLRWRTSSLLAAK